MNDIMASRPCAPAPLREIPLNATRSNMNSSSRPYVKRSTLGASLLLGVLGLAIGSPLVARTYDVGPDQEFAAIGRVPWESLAAGDTVRIHWRPEPYREKWAICTAGSAEAPLTVIGLPGPDAQMPVVDGNRATTREAMDFWGEDRAVIKVGGTNAAPTLLPRHIVIENLEIRGATSAHSFQGRKGDAPYRDNAAAIWLESGENLTVRNCRLYDCANGLVSSRQTRNVLVEGCSIYGNGTELGIYQHNVYTESEGITFQFNRLGPLRPDAFGINLKDRSSGTVIRYNWIEGGNRLIDLVESDYPHIYERADYRESFVYGNVLIKLPDSPNKQVCHYGGDQDNPAKYRNGTLYMCHNTIVSRRAGAVTLFRLTAACDTVVIRNNIFWCSSSAGSMLLMPSLGTASLGLNWFPQSFETMLRFVRSEEGVRAEAEQIFGVEPGFLDAAGGDYRLAPGSVCSGRAVPLPDAMLPRYALTAEYVPHGGQRPRNVGAAADLGAFGVAAAKGL